MKIVMIRHIIVAYLAYFVCEIVMIGLHARVVFSGEGQQYQIYYFILDQVMYVILLCAAIHYREMNQRKAMNYDRVLNVEINKTNNLISKLVPYHMLENIKDEKRAVDEFEDCTVMITSIGGFELFRKSFKDNREAVGMIGRLFTRFDQVCEANKVYKV